MLSEIIAKILASRKTYKSASNQAGYIGAMPIAVISSVTCPSSVAELPFMAAVIGNENL